MDMNRMKINTFAMIATLSLLGGVAVAESPSEKMGVNSVLGIAPKTQDFVTEAASSGEFEIQSSQLALARNPDAATKAFATRMIADHQKIGAELKALVQAKAINVTLPTQLSSAEQSMLDKLKTMNGADFDKQYREDQVKGHKNAVNLFQRYGKGGDNADLQKWAMQTEPMLSHHLQMARDLNQQAAK
jgi:putative membrane protein